MSSPISRALLERPDLDPIAKEKEVRQWLLNMTETVGTPPTGPSVNDLGLGPLSREEQGRDYHQRTFGSIGSQERNNPRHPGSEAALSLGDTAGDGSSVRGRVSHVPVGPELRVIRDTTAGANGPGYDLIGPAPLSKSPSRPSGQILPSAPRSNVSSKTALSASRTIQQVDRQCKQMRRKYFTKLSDLPPEVQNVALPFLKLANKREFIPEAQRDLAEAIHETADISHVLAKGPIPYSSIPDKDWMFHYAEAIAACREAFKHEPAWNTDIHAPIFEAVRSLMPHKEYIKFENATSVQIEEKYTANGKLKKIDFCLKIKVDEKTLDDLASCEVYRLAPTEYTALAESIPFVGIETKTMNGDVVEALAQGMIWTFAHMEKLEELLKLTPNAHAPIPPVPFLILSGLTSSISFCERRDGQNFLWIDIEIGHSRTALDVAVVCAALQTLGAYACPYETWFYKHIINPILKANGKAEVDPPASRAWARAGLPTFQVPQVRSSENDRQRHEGDQGVRKDQPVQQGNREVMSTAGSRGWGGQRGRDGGSSRQNPRGGNKQQRSRGGLTQQPQHQRDGEAWLGDQGNSGRPNKRRRLDHSGEDIPNTLPPDEREASLGRKRNLRSGGPPTEHQ